MMLRLELEYCNNSTTQESSRNTTTTTQPQTENQQQQQPQFMQTNVQTTHTFSKRYSTSIRSRAELEEYNISFWHFFSDQSREQREAKQRTARRLFGGARREPTRRNRVAAMVFCKCFTIWWFITCDSLYHYQNSLVSNLPYIIGCEIALCY